MFLKSTASNAPGGSREKGRLAEPKNRSGHHRTWRERQQDQGYLQKNWYLLCLLMLLIAIVIILAPTPPAQPDCDEG